MIAIRRLRLSIGGLLVACATSAYCDSYSSENSRYSGCYLIGFETSAFTPTGTKESWWVEWEADTTLLSRALPRTEGNFRGVQSVFVVVRGSVSARGKYGHMGGSARQIVVSEVISARKPLPEDRCGSSAAVEPGPAGAESLYLHGLFMEKEGKTQDAVRMYRRAARSGNGKAAKRLVEIYDKGIPGVPRDYAESLSWYEKTKQLGEAVNPPGMR